MADPISPAAAPAAPSPSDQALPTPAPVAPTPAASASPQPAAAATPSPAASTPAAAPTGQEPVSGTAATPSALLQVAKLYGIDPQQIADEQQFARLIFDRAQQAAQYEQVFGPDYDAYRNWKREQEDKARVQPKKTRDVPEWKAEWYQHLRRDADGTVVAAPDAPPGIVEKYRAFANYQRQVLERFATDPQSIVEELGLNDLVHNKVEELLKQHVSQLEDAQFMRRFEREHAWLYQTDANNQITYDYNGTPRLSPWGEQFARYVKQVEAQGVQGRPNQMQLAMAMIQNDWLRARLSQNQPVGGTPTAPPSAPAPDVSLKQQFLQAGNPPGAAAQHRANYTPALQDMNDPNTPASGQNLNLRDMMLRLARANGSIPATTP